VAGQNVNTAPNEAAERALEQALRPRLEDYGLRVEHTTSPVAYFQVSSDELVLSDEVVRAAEKAFAKDQLQPVVTYLANTLVIGSGESQRKIPYSTITGVDSVAGLGPLLNDSGEPVRLKDDEIALNRWAADDLGAKLGDTITVTYYEPESTHGVLREHEPPLRLRLAHIAELEKGGQPAPAADPHLTPELPGVTDQKSISDWDLPFELVETIRSQDEEYWDTYRTTPKAFVSLSTGKRLWASRWGTISLLRIGEPAGEVTAATGDVAAQLTKYLKPADVGMAFQPVKRLGLEASSGTTPFDGLFLGFSFFLIAAAVMLIWLLFRLGVEQRASELGILAATGLQRQQITPLLAREGLVVAAAGATVGVLVGVLYAWLIITGLRTWWVAAIATPFLALHVSLRSLLFGWLAGVAVSWLTIYSSIRRLVRLPVGRLLVGATDTGLAERDAGTASPQSWSRFREALVALAVALCVIGFLLRGEAQAGVFFGSGAVVLTLVLGEVYHRLRVAGRTAPSHRTFNLAGLSALNTARHPGRSTLTVGLVATATFLIVAISAFRLETGDEGTGGFALLATSDLPIHFDLNTRNGRAELGFSDDDSAQLDDWRVYSLRVAAGEDASCLNLYRPTQPRVLGVPETLMDRGGFAWAETAAGSGDHVSADKPWTLLHAELGNDDAGRAVVPVVLDASTAVYSLHLGGVGSRLVIRDAADRPVTLEVVGLLKNSVLQGNVLMSEANFLKLFPDTGGYRFFLIERVASDKVSGERSLPTGSTGADARAIGEVLETTLAAEGFNAVDAREQLAEFLAVQNTYLSTFQSLGALGLLLGTVGLAVVQLRSVLERRGELALMQAAGFGRRRLTRMVVWENGVLLVGGLAAGILAATVALVPQWAPHGATVPWMTLAVLLGTICVVGLAAGWWATRSALQSPLVPALRGD
jgi:ABC-type lipoprotein release transport system permease subunit